MQHFWTEWYARERLATRLRESEAADIIVEVTRQDSGRPAPRPVPIRVRLRRASDAEALDRLASLAQRSPPRGVVVVAEDAGRVVVAVELNRDLELVDPQFDRPEVVELVRLRARQIAARAA